jgi:hypothetical protein
MRSVVHRHLYLIIERERQHSHPYLLSASIKTGKLMMQPFKCKHRVFNDSRAAQLNFLFNVITGFTKKHCWRVLLTKSLPGSHFLWIGTQSGLLRKRTNSTVPECTRMQCSVPGSFREMFFTIAHDAVE